MVISITHKHLLCQEKAVVTSPQRGQQVESEQREREVNNHFHRFTFLLTRFCITDSTHLLHVCILLQYYCV